MLETFRNFTKLQRLATYNDFALSVFMGVTTALYIPAFVELFGGEGMVYLNATSGLVGLIALVPGLLAYLQSKSRTSFTVFLWADMLIVVFLMAGLAGVLTTQFILVYVGSQMLLVPLKMPLMKMIDQKVRNDDEDFIRFESQTDVICAVLIGGLAISATMISISLWIAVPVILISMFVSRILRYKISHIVWPKEEDNGQNRDRGIDTFGGANASS